MSRMQIIGQSKRCLSPLVFKFRGSSAGTLRMILLSVLLTGCNLQNARPTPAATPVPAPAAQTVFAPAPVASSVSAPPTAPIRYTVKKGDTLESIAQLVFGDKTMWTAIWYENPDIKDPHKLFPGDVLVVGTAGGQPTLSFERNGQVATTDTRPPADFPALLKPTETEMPTASARYEIPADFFRNSATTKHGIDTQLKAALADRGYDQVGYYSLPQGYDGFALVTAIEQVRPDGSPMDSTHRWTENIYKGDWTSIDFWKHAFSRVTGYFRIIVFVVSSPALPSSADTQKPYSEARTMVRGGAPTLPANVAAQPAPAQFTCIAYIYEYQSVPSNLDNPISLVNADHQDQLHDFLVALRNRR